MKINHVTLIVVIVAFGLLTACTQSTSTSLPSTTSADLPDFQWTDQTIKDIYNTDIPAFDPVEAGSRLYGVGYTYVIEGESTKWSVGNVREFWISQGAEEQTGKVTATLRSVTDHLYIWIQDGISYDQDQLSDLSTSFEESIYNQVRAVFGSEWDPGVDDDSHINLLYSTGIGEGMGGYFSSTDEYQDDVFPSSNVCEILVINADEIPLNGKAIERVSSHELQHMIHWNADKNEDVWVNEGMSEYSVQVAGILDLRLAQQYLSNTDRSLDYWENAVAGLPNAPLYGQTFLFTTYFSERFGNKVLRSVVDNPSNGLVGYDKSLQPVHEDAPGSKIVNVFVDWVAANILQSDPKKDNRYGYTAIRGMSVTPNGSFGICENTSISDTVNQFGVDYYQFSCPGTWSIHFEGDDNTRLVSPDPFSGSYFAWSNRADKSDTLLTRSFDLTGVSGNAFLTYQTWYDTEQGRDYLYVQVSDNGGATWKFMDRPTGFDNSLPNDPDWGISGHSDWKENRIDLSPYIGKNILVRFEYITDTSLTGDGVAIDDISLSAIDYFCDFETDSCGWLPKGFVRINPVVNQYFRIILIDKKSKQKVTEMLVDNSNIGDLTFSVLKSDQPVTLAIMAVTPFSIKQAGYTLNTVYVPK